MFFFALATQEKLSRLVHALTLANSVCNGMLLGFFMAMVCMSLLNVAPGKFVPRPYLHPLKLFPHVTQRSDYAQSLTPTIGEICGASEQILALCQVIRGQPASADNRLAADVAQKLLQTKDSPFSVVVLLAAFVLFVAKNVSGSSLR